MTRNGKIARLPLAVRDELNQRIENGEVGVRLIEWLNGLAEVNAVLKEHFGGQPIRDANLTQWKNGGFLDWQALRKAEGMVERWPLDCGLGIADGFPKPAADGFPSTGDALSRKAGGMSGKVAAALTERLMVHYAAALEDALGGADEKARKHVERLGLSLREVVRVRRYDLAREQARERAELNREWLALERERLELLRSRASRHPTGQQPDDKERLSHQEKAEMVKRMLEEA